MNDPEHGWKYLHDRKNDIRLTMFYKVINEIINVPKEEILYPLLHYEGIGNFMGFH